ncbi:TPA: hypothetical protein ACH3X1_005113 [Trebouxia sp. C0004]
MNSLHQQLAPSFCFYCISSISSLQQLALVACMNEGALLPAVMSVHIEGRLPVWCCRMSVVGIPLFKAMSELFEANAGWRVGQPPSLSTCHPTCRPACLSKLVSSSVHRLQNSGLLPSRLSEWPAASHQQHLQQL